MAIRAPGVSQKKSGVRKRVDAAIALIPFVDLLLTVVVFLLMTFSVSEIPLAQDLPRAVHGRQLANAPIISMDAQVVTVDGRRVAETASLLTNARLERVEPLVVALTNARDNYEAMHPGQRFPGRVILQVDRSIDYRAVRKVLFSAGLAGYGGIDLAVRR